MNMDKKLTNIDLAKQVCKLNQLPAHVNPIQDGHFRGCSRMGGGGQKGSPSLKFVTHILQ